MGQVAFVRAYVRTTSDDDGFFGGGRTGRKSEEDAIWICRYIGPEAFMDNRYGYVHDVHCVLVGAVYHIVLGGCVGELAWKLRDMCCASALPLGCVLVLNVYIAFLVGGASRVFVAFFCLM